jgi:hypothetical protein
MADARLFRKNMPTQVLRAECEACHIRSKNQPLSMMPVGATCSFEDGIMTTKMRRMAYWWFRIVVSGRFLAKFLNLRGVTRT